MIVKDISLETPQENVLFDEVLLYLAEQGKGEEALRFWESSKLFIVLGRTSNPIKDIHIPAVLQDKIPVVRRSSGGGTVLQGKGCLNYSLVLSKERHPQIQWLRKSYQYILGNITESLAAKGIHAEFQPVSDIAIEGRKFSGNAQKRGRKFILHHGTILYDFDLAQMEKYLKIPGERPVYRKDRSHSDFVRNIPMARSRAIEILSSAFEISQKNNVLTAEERDGLKRFLKTKEIAVDLKPI